MVTTVPTRCPNLRLAVALLLGIFCSNHAWAINTPSGVVARAGDRSVVLHWTPGADSSIRGYRVYQATSPGGSFFAGELLKHANFALVDATNGVTYRFQVAAVGLSSEESARSEIVTAVPHPFSRQDEFLDYVQGTAFDYFWCEANPANGLVRDRSTPDSPVSIAAVGFGLTSIGIGVDHGWITRAEGRERILATLETLRSGPQGTNVSGCIGYRGWFYHFLDMRTAVRFTRFNTELSSIDTALLLAGVLYARQYFDGTDPAEARIRLLADQIYRRIDWSWMARGSDVLSMGWQPPGKFLASNWVGYNEAMILYLLGLGAENPLPSSSWERWTAGYSWITFSNLSFVPFPPLFGHQYSHCWVDFRNVADPYMRAHNSTYFENSRRATLAQRLYCIANPQHHVGYRSNVWGLTASDDPSGYLARGAPPPQNDNGTIAPTAPGGSVMFAPEVCVPALRYLYDNYRTNLWTGYGFRDAFNPGKQWWGRDTVGIDQGPILISIENYRTQRVWKRFMQAPEVQRGFQRAGFVPVSK